MSHQKPLTRKQKEVLEFIEFYSKEKGYAPTYREIAAAMGKSSPATIHEHIKSLEKKGHLTMDKGRARAVEMVHDLTLDPAHALFLPLVGLITAGQPIEAIEEHETMAVPADLVVDAINTYVLRVKGESMIEDGILDGDLVVVERNPSPKDGDVVVALLDNAYATLKRFYRETQRIRLQPANSSMQPIYVQDPIIQGVVRAVIRKFATL
ncbi:transcriptional repressor LexA [Candidatus Uhrbacteria bacterium]|nr:transcriptional repressor LexA [Candidatus Uhrbacteria bacterium]